MKTLLIIAIITTPFFILFPEVDIWFSGLFYDDSFGFIYQEHFGPKAIYNFVEILSTSLSIFLILSLVIRKVFGSKYFLNYRQTIFLIAALSLGPGVIVHNVFKDNWGRARPINITEFGGVKKFTPAWIISDQGEKSFMSGHASPGFFLSAFAFVVAATNLQKLIYIGGIFAGTLFGLGRILQGKHYLSDVVFSGIIVLLVIHILAMIILKKPSLSSQKLS